MIKFIIRVFASVYSWDSSPLLFGSKARAEKKNYVARGNMKQAKDVEKEIALEKTRNPFESAGARSAMKEASSSANKMQNRMLNTLGTNASPEALLSLQGNLSESVGATSGSIATGAERNKMARIGQLENRYDSKVQASSNAAMSAAEEEGSGWTTLFQGVDAVGKLASGVGSIAAASDRRVKENIVKIGNVQGYDLYKFNYIGNKTVVIGVMAQDLGIEHKAVIDTKIPINSIIETEDTDNLLAVDYNKIFNQD